MGLNADKITLAKKSYIARIVDLSDIHKNGDSSLNFPKEVQLALAKFFFESELEKTLSTWEQSIFRKKEGEDEE
jgi:hypothetical protein